MKIIYAICRIILGLFFFVIGVDGFLNFLPQQIYNVEFKNLLEVMRQTGYLLEGIYMTQIIMATLLLINFAVTLASLVLFIFLGNYFLVFYLLSGVDLASNQLIYLYVLIGINVVLLISKGKNYLALLK